jgi:long-subunit acyl-CoA synthetase (AMP-forming)
MTPQGATAQTVPATELQTVQRDTIARLFITAVDRHDRPDALQHKQTGMWRSISHREVEERVTRLAAALGEMGIGRGDRVGLLSENRPEWALVDFATLGIGAADVPIYPTLPPNQIAYILKDSGAKAIFVSTQEQLEKILEIRGDLPDLQQVVVFDDPGGASNVVTLHDVLERGRQAIDAGTAPASASRPTRWDATTWQLSSTPPAPPATPRGSCSPTTTWPPTWPAPSSTG